MSFAKTWHGILLLVAVACSLDSNAPSVSHDGGVAPRIARLLASEHDPATRFQALERLFAEATPADLTEIQYRYDAAAPYLYPQDLQLFASWWAAFDAEHALENARAGASVPSELWRTQVLRAWAARDPEAARAAWSDGACGDSSDRCLQALVAGWYASGNDSVWTFVESLPISFGSQRALDVIVANLVADRGIDAAIQLAEAIDPETRHRFKLQVYRRIASEVSVRDVERAKRFAEENTSGPVGDGLLRRVAVRWSARDARAAMEWVIAQPPGPQRDDAVQAASRRWIQNDRASALAWLRRSVDREPLQPALGAFAIANALDDPEGSLDIVDWITDEDARQVALKTILRIWTDRSPKEAKRWRQEAGLADGFIEKVHRAPVRTQATAQPR